MWLLIKLCYKHFVRRCEIITHRQIQADNGLIKLALSGSSETLKPFLPSVNLNCAVNNATISVHVNDVLSTLFTVYFVSYTQVTA